MIVFYSFLFATAYKLWDNNAMSIKNTVHLIVYPNSLGENLTELNTILRTHASNLFGGVHILPFYPSNGDRGFSPLTHLEVDPQYGDWSDISNLSKKYELTADLIVNHVSESSLYVRDCLKNGKKSAYWDMLLWTEKLHPDGHIPDVLMDKVYRRKFRYPVKTLSVMDLPVEVWNTFGDDQIDVDVDSAKTKEVFEEYIAVLASQGISTLRFDAVGYIIKKLGSSCFFQIPELFDYMTWAKKICDKYGVEILPELHLDYKAQLDLATHGYWVYDFALPVLVLHTLYEKSTLNLKKWLAICPQNQVTVLDTHDGIGIVDATELLTEKEIESVQANINLKGGEEVSIASGTASDNVDVYQINCTYYSALGEDDDLYIMARAIQFFTPGVPQVYYVGWLAGSNDNELVKATHHGRDINRHSYTETEIAENMTRDVVKRLNKLIKFRSSYRAFEGKMEIMETSDMEITIVWKYDDTCATLEVDTIKNIAKITYLEDGIEKIFVA
jgi:sucrose phosphorylase